MNYMNSIDTRGTHCAYVSNSSQKIHSVRMTELNGSIFFAQLNARMSEHTLAQYAILKTRYLF